MTAHFPVGNPDHKRVKSGDELPLETSWSEVHDCVPLKQRLKMLLAKAVCKSRDKILISAKPPIDVVKKEDDDNDSLAIHSDHDRSEERSDGASCGQSKHGTVHAIETSSLQERMLSERLEVEYTDAYDDSASQLQNCQDVPCSVDDNEISEVLLDDLDHIVLKERQRMLLSRKLVGSIRPAIEHNLSNQSTTLEDMILQNPGRESDICGIRSAIGGKEIFEKRGGNIYAFREALESGSINGIIADAPAFAHPCQGSTLAESGKYKNVCGEANPCSSSRSGLYRKSFLSSSCKTVPTLALPSFPNVKVEPLDNVIQIPNKDGLGNLMSVKSELVNSAESPEDIIDHMLLGDRMKLLASRKFPKTILYENFENSRTFVPSGDDCRPALSESSKPLRMKQPRKRRKTVTDSVETALEEDAPGLLQVLIEKGVLVDEIKLYGETEGDDSLDESPIEESFSELEVVISKIFSQRQAFLKFAPLRCSKGEKASYCLACLISLVEQARYLQFRKWPVEWGWCRDLQSFIFVFEKHNRIVLERPEYGYATYFFELVDTLPVHWQIKRLVTAMKLTSCSRITLIENRALTVGDDLTEGEARVLMEYGWIPDSGLGTMLNYCDRVIHDRKHESDSSEWRSKIGKLLTDGYIGGTIVPSDIPKKLTEYGVGPSLEVKLEP